MLALPLTARAEMVKQLFETSLPVVSQDREVRQAAFEQGFAEILVRVSGSSEAASQIGAQAAAGYVQQYRYLAVEKKPEKKTAQPAENAEPEARYKLWVQFNESRIINLLKQSGLSVWGAQRPRVLLWLSVKDGRNRYILREKDMSVIKDMVEKEITRRGLPIVWPLFDDQDQKQVSFLDVSGQFWGAVTQASQRYSADAIALCRMSWDGSVWNVDWSLLLDEQPVSKRISRVDLESSMSEGVDFLADSIAARFAVLDDVMDDGELILQVNGIDAEASYARVLHYLASIASVKHVFPVEFQQDHVRFHLDMSGNAQDLQRLIALGRVLEKVTVVESKTPDQPQTENQPATNQPVTGDDKNTPQNQLARLEKNILIYKIK